MSRPGDRAGPEPRNDVVAALERLAARTSGSEESPHARIDAILQGLAAQEVDAIARIQQRWADAGHPPGSFPDPSEMEADDTGNVVDGDSMALIATPGEWELYARLHAALTRPGE